MIRVQRVKLLLRVIK